MVNKILITAPQPAETTTPVSNNLVTDHRPNLLAIPKTKTMEKIAPANAALVRRIPPAPSKIAERAPTAAPPEIPRI